jgi:hypothetical protein
MTLDFKIVALALSCSLAAWLGAQGAAAQSAEQRAEYERVIRHGLEEYRLGNFAEMYAAMRRAHELDPNARTLRGMGVAAFELKDYVAALVHLRAALVDTRKPLTRELQSEVESMLDRARLYVDTVNVRVEPEEAVLTVDGGAPVRDEDGKVLLALGRHEFVASLAGHESTTHAVQAVGGKAHEIALTLSVAGAPPASEREAGAAASTGLGTDRVTAADDPGATQRTWAYVTLGIGGAFAIATGVALGLRQAAAVRYGSDACPQPRSVTCADEADQVHTMKTLAIAGGAATGVAVITGMVLLLTADTTEPGSASACLPGGPGVLCRVQF